jgi:hypothetical protein
VARAGENSGEGLRRWAGVGCRVGRGEQKMNGGVDGRAAARGGVLCWRQNMKQRSRADGQRAEGVQRKKKRGRRSGGLFCEN